MAEDYEEEYLIDPKDTVGDKFLFQQTVNAQLNRILKSQIDAFRDCDIPHIDAYEGSITGLETILFNYVDEKKKYDLIFLDGKTFSSNYLGQRKNILNKLDRIDLIKNREQRIIYLSIIRDWNLLIVKTLLPHVGLIPGRKTEVKLPDLSREKYEGIKYIPDSESEEE